MGKNKKEKLPPTKEELISNDPLWDKVFKLRLNRQDKEAEDLKNQILTYYQ